MKQSHLTKPSLKHPGPRLGTEAYVARQRPGGLSALAKFVCVAALLLSAAPSVRETTPTAAEVVSAVRAAYASLTDLSATGCVRGDSVEADGSMKPIFVFCERDITAFYSAPDTLLLSILQRGSKEWPPWSYMLSVRGQGASWVSSAEPEVKSGTVQSGLSSAYSVGGGCASILAGLTMPQVHADHSLAELRDATVVGAEDCGGTKCWVLQGVLRHRKTTLWVASQDWFVRQATIEYSSDQGLVRHTINFGSLSIRRASEDRMVQIVGSGS